MKAKVKATGKVIEVYRIFFNDELVSYKHEQDNGRTRIYRLDELDELSETNLPYEGLSDWANIRVNAAIFALQGCIEAGKPNPVQSAMRYSKELIDALRAELD